jgi:hypothetical protein
MTRKPSMKTARLLLLAGALIGVACSSGQSSSKSPKADRTFAFAPRVGTKFKHEMKNLEEFAIAGSSYRDSVESRVLWEVVVTEQSDSKFIYRRRLVELGLKVNGAELLKGPEVEPRRAEIEQVMSKDGHVLDVTGTEQLTQALRSVVPEANRARVSEIFSPENLRELLKARAVDAFEEVVGKPTDLGSTWGSKNGYGPLKGKTVLVDSSIGCGGKTCLKLKRTFDVDKEQVGDAVRLHLAGALAQAGIDPAAVQVVGADFKVEDTFVVEPETCHFHDANLTQQAKFVFQGPKGNKVEVVHTSKQTSHAEYPPPS